MSDADGPKDTDQIFMDELKLEFMDTVAANLKEMSELYRKNNFEDIARIAHDIKGTSGIFGLDEGTEIAMLLQFAAQDKKAEKTKELLEKLTEYMRKNGIIS
ncbi:MAG: Hpt domain-containing protein [Candidatus Aminicenantes bacterium]|jgi:HPt (histidine-containing phosphotransfer) domain-containing protein